MSDEAIVGIVAIMVTGVLGPMIAFQISKLQGASSDHREMLDHAIDAVTHAEGSVNVTMQHFARSGITRQDIEPYVREMHTQARNLDASVAKLAIRFGEQSALVQAYMDAAFAVAQVGIEFDTQDPNSAAVQESVTNARDSRVRFIRLAGRWHEDEWGGPVIGLLRRDAHSQDT